MSKFMEDFINNGFCIIPNAISQDLVLQANQQLDAFLAKNHESLSENGLLVDGMLHRVVNLHFCISTLQKIFCDSMRLASEIVDSFGRATLYTSLFFEAGSGQELHRDTPYFYSGSEGGYMGAWIALDDVDENNGALIAVEGSHKIPEPDLKALKDLFHPDEEVPNSSTPLFNAYNESLRRVANDLGLRITTCSVKKGDMILWNPSTLHGGLSHLDKKRSRRSFVMHITPKNQPIKQMDYFFNKAKPIEAEERPYFQIEDRLVAAGSEVSFRHTKSYSVSELGIF